MSPTYSFGEWLQQRREHLRLTQRALAVATHCSLAMIKKIEADERHPSPELAAAATQLQKRWPLKADFTGMATREQLFISEETVKAHMKHIMEKLSANDRTQAVAIALRRGIIQL